MAHSKMENETSNPYIKHMEDELSRLKSENDSQNLCINGLKAKLASLNLENENLKAENLKEVDWLKCYSISEPIHSRMITLSDVKIQTSIGSKLWKGQFCKEDAIIKEFVKKDKGLELSLYLGCKHEGIISVSHHGRVENDFYVILENMGGTLLTYMNNHCPANKHLFTDITKIILKQMLDVVGYLHSQHLTLDNLSPNDILVDNLSCPTKFKLHEFSSCRELKKNPYDKKDFRFFARFAYWLLSGSEYNKRIEINCESFKSFLDPGCAVDAINKMLTGRRRITYFKSHPWIYSEADMVTFINIFSDLAGRTNFFGREDYFSSFLVLEGGSRWFDKLNEVAQKEVQARFTLEVCMSKQHNWKGYDGREVKQVPRFNRNFNHHRNMKISGNCYPRSNVDNMIRPFPHLMPVSYNLLVDVSDKSSLTSDEMECHFKISLKFAV